MNRIETVFARLRARRQKAFVLYLGAGDPNLEVTRQLAVASDQAGVDVLELGVPFSDPLADGVVNQLAAQRGLESGTTPSGVLAAVAAVRRESQIPIVLYLYFNLVHRRGLERFIQEAATAGVDGLLILDLPVEEAEEYQQLMRAAGLCAIYLVAPTTPEDRVELICRRASGFVYYVSREGVTGMQARVSESIAPMTSCIRRHTDLPIVVGFGISNPDQARQVAAYADGVVVGSAVVRRLAAAGSHPERLQEVIGFLRSLVQAAKSPCELAVP